MSRDAELITAHLMTAAAATRRWADAVAAGEGQTHARWQVLGALAGSRELTVPQLARRLGLTRQSVQRVVDQLFADGLVTWGRNPDHRTSALVLLTPRGASVLAGITHEAERASRALVRDMGAAELEALHGLLKRLTDVTSRPGASSL